jgi:hypothetical protein
MLSNSRALPSSSTGNQPAIRPTLENDELLPDHSVRPFYNESRSKDRSSRCSRHSNVPPGNGEAYHDALWRYCSRVHPLSGARILRTREPHTEGRCEDPRPWATSLVLYAGLAGNVFWWLVESDGLGGSAKYYVGFMSMMASLPCWVL